MSIISRIAAAIVTCLAIAAPAAPAGGRTGNESCGGNTVASLLMGIRSDNEGLRESAAYVLGEIKCTGAVIPLMGMLHDERSESARIAAALALSLIGEARGVFAVKQAVKFDESRRVRLVCAYFYNEYVHPQTFAFVTSEQATPSHYASN